MADITCPNGDSVVVTLSIETPHGGVLQGCKRHISTFLVDKKSHVSISFNGPRPDEVGVARKLTSSPSSWTQTSISPPLLGCLLLDSEPSRAEWLTLTALICSWLVQTSEERHTDEWKWGVNYYWIAYTGAYPAFPYDPSAMPIYASSEHWNSVIPMYGNYLASRMDALSYGYFIEEPNSTNRLRALRRCLDERSDAMGH